MIMTRRNDLGTFEAPCGGLVWPMGLQRQFHLTADISKTDE